MRWRRITIQRARNGFVIKVDFYPDREELYVIESDEKELLEVLKDVLVGEAD
jgi:hypothetical protein